MNFDEGNYWEDWTPSPKGKETAEKLKKLGIKSPKGKLEKIDSRTWRVKKT